MWNFRHYLNWVYFILVYDLLETNNIYCNKWTESIRDYTTTNTADPATTIQPSSLFSIQ